MDGKLMDEQEYDELIKVGELSDFTKSIRKILDEVSKEYNIDPVYPAALIKIISDYNPYYSFFDYKHYDWLRGQVIRGFKPCTDETERVGQATKWGLLGLSGFILRNKLDYKSVFLSSILDPEANIVYGVKYIRQIYDRYFEEYGWDGIIASFDLGKPKFYQGGKDFINTGFIERVNKEVKLKQQSSFRGSKARSKS